jgi:hypothetical protein
VVSGGPDADGGAPDRNLVLGIGTQRSIFTHSIVMGSALETAFLSLADLVRLIDGNLPPEHDLLRDHLANQAGTLTRSASVGARLGMAYRLAVDGTAGTYHGLPVDDLAEVVHRAIAVANGSAEAIDAGGKPKAKPATTLVEATEEERKTHRLYLRKQFAPRSAAIEMRDADERLINEKYGSLDAGAGRWRASPAQ